MNKARRSVIQAIGLVLLAWGASSALKAQVPWDVGDVFVAVGKGTYLVYRFNGTKYVLVQTILVTGFGSSDQTSGCAFDSQLNFYATDTTSGLTAELNSISQSVVQTLSTGAGTTSVMFDASGNLYVGLGSVKHVPPAFGMLKFVPTLPPNTGTGTITYPAAPTSTFNANLNSDWIDLANDQKTLYLTNETASVDSEDLSAAAPAPSLFTTPSAGQTGYAVRVLSPFDGSGGFLVADSNNVVKLDSTGTIPTFYVFGNSKNLRALTLDPNGTSAWVADFKSGNVYRFNIQTGAIEFTIATPGGSSPNGLCVKGGPELNVVPLVYNVGTGVSATAKFGAPGTVNFHTWQATIDDVLSSFVLVVTATEGIDLHRFDEYFCDQAIQGNSFGCSYTPPPAFRPTLTPVPYADQLDIHGHAQAGKPVVYRAANPPPITSYSGNIFVYDSYTYPPLSGTGGFYTPPTCLNGTLGDPRAFRAPSSAPPNDAGNLQFAFDFTTFSDLIDNGSGGIIPHFNDYNVADRCPSSVGSSGTFLSPIQKARVSLGSSLAIKVNVVDASGNSIIDATNSQTGTGFNNMTLSITQFGLPLTVLGVKGNSPDFFKIESDNTYHANLDTSSVPDLQTGLATLCVTSINTASYQSDGLVGTSAATAEFPAFCTDILLH